MGSEHLCLEVHSSKIIYEGGNFTIIKGDQFANSIMHENSLHRPIEEKYNTKIFIKSEEILVFHQTNTIIDEVSAELGDLIKKFTLDSNSRWMYQGIDGYYNSFQRQHIAIIEEAFRSFYYQLTTPKYENYSLSFLLLD